MKTYKVCKADNFSNHLFTSRPMPLNKQIPMEGIEPPPLTTLFKERKCDQISPFDHYFIEHEKIETVAGRMGPVTFTQYIHRYAIYAYHQPQTGLFLLSGKKRAVSDLLRQGGLTLNIQSLNFDLNAIQKGVDRVHTVWFRFFDGQFSSTSFHGDDIKAIVEQQDLFRKGQISSMAFTVRYEGRAHTLLLSHDGTLVIQNPSSDVASELQFLQHIYDLLLKHNVQDAKSGKSDHQWREEIREEFEENVDPYSLYQTAAHM